MDMDSQKASHIKLLLSLLLLSILGALFYLFSWFTKPTPISQSQQDLQNQIKAEQALIENKRNILTRVSTSTPPLSQTEKNQIFRTVGGEKGTSYNFSAEEKALLINKLNQ